MYGYIYKTTNTINNKIYIGQHKYNNYNSRYVGSGTLLRRAIEKYGKESFKVEVLEECETKELLDERERYYIDYYNSRDPSIGYNVTQGGQLRFFTGMTHSEESRKKMRERALLRDRHEPTTAGRKYVNKEGKNKCIPADQVESYLTAGYSLGRIREYQPPWNKGLTKEVDERVRRNQDGRKKRFDNKEAIGCCGLTGDSNKKRQATRRYLDSLDVDEVKSFWEENGKCATQHKYSAYSVFSYSYLCERCGIVDTPEHNFKIRSKAVKKKNQLDIYNASNSGEAH